MEEIKVEEILNTILKNKIQIILIICIFITIGVVYSFSFVTPKYTSSITMVLVSTSNDENTNSTITTTDINLNSKLISTYSKLVKSKTVLKEVISKLNLNIDINNLRNNVSVGSINNTELIEVKVSNENAELAARIANEIGRVFKEKVREMYNINNVEIMSEAKVEREPANINHKKDVIVFGLLGIIVSIVYVSFVNMLDTTIKNPDTIEEEFGLPVLSSIPILRRKRQKEEWR